MLFFTSRFFLLFFLLFFIFFNHPVFAISTLDTCSAPDNVIMCEQLFAQNATKTAISSSGESATITNIETKVVQRGTDTVLRQNTVVSPFAATLGKWAAGVGLGGLLTFMGIPSLDDARQSLVDQYAASHPQTGGETGQVAGRMYAPVIMWSTADNGVSQSVGDYNVLGPAKFKDVYLSLFSISAVFTDGTGASRGSSANVYTGASGFQYLGFKFISASVSEQQDKSQDPNAAPPPTNWSNATQAERDRIVNDATNEQLKNLYSVAPVVGVPSPSATEDVYYKPQGSQEWVKIPNSIPQSINKDTNNDGVIDTDIDKNADGVPDVNITPPSGSNVNGLINEDTNGDGVPDVNIDSNGDGVCDSNIRGSDGSITTPSPSPSPSSSPSPDISPSPQPSSSPDDSGGDSSEVPTFSDILCQGFDRVTGFLPPSPDDILASFTSEYLDLPFLGPSVTAMALWDLYIVLKVVLAWKIFNSLKSWV